MSADLVDYFRRACKPRSEFRVGIEVEKMGVDARSGLPIPYDGPRASVRNVLEAYLRARGGRVVAEHGALVGIEGSWGSISLEPGGQIEWSSKPRSSLDHLAHDLDSHLRALHDAGDALGVRWLEVAVHPDVLVSEMPWMPKARYGIMRRHLGARGRLAHRMMTQTASIQCAFDYETFEDWTRRFRAAALLAPVAVALFANSRRVEGADSGFRSFRQAIWRETDPDRSGIPPVVFRRDFGVETWIEWLLDIPTLFVHGPGETLEPAGGTPFRALMARQERNPISEKDWELHLSCVFTEVRSYDYIEVRSADLQPDSRIMAVPAFWTGLLYHSRALDAALELTRSHDSHPLWAESMESASRRGLDGTAAGRPLRELASRALSMARWGLEHGADCAGSSGTSADLLGTLSEQLSLPVCDGELQAG